MVEEVSSLRVPEEEQILVCTHELLTLMHPLSPAFVPPPACSCTVGDQKPAGRHYGQVLGWCVGVHLTRRFAAGLDKPRIIECSSWEVLEVI